MDLKKKRKDIFHVHLYSRSWLSASVHKYDWVRQRSI